MEDAPGRRDDGLCGRRHALPHTDAVPSIALVANPRSGTGTDSRKVAAGLEAAGADVREFPLERLEEAAAAGADRLAVAGGDGTIAPAAAAAAGAGLPLAVIPIGTANDFARGLRLPLDLGAACRLAASGSELRTLELGRMDGRPFVNVASLGLAVRAAQRAHALKRGLGAPAYLLGAVRAGLTEAPVDCRVTCDGVELFDGAAWQVMVASSGRFGAGSRVGVADPGDGLLDVAVIAGGSRLRLAAYAYGLRSGRITARRGVRHARASLVEVAVPERTPYNVDGEIILHGPARFEIEPRAFELVVR